jgi:hypothetical protein
MILDKATLDAHGTIQIDIPMNHSPSNMELESCDGSRILHRNIDANSVAERPGFDVDAYYAQKKLHISRRSDYFKMEEARNYGHVWNAAIEYLVIKR